MEYKAEDVVVKYFDGEILHIVDGFYQDEERVYSVSKNTGSMKIAKDYPEYDAVVRAAKVGSLVKYGDKQYVLTACSEDEDGFNGQFEEV